MRGDRQDGACQIGRSELIQVGHCLGHVIRGAEDNAEEGQDEDVDIEA